MSKIENKALLRAAVLARRDAIDARERERRSRALCDRLERAWADALPHGATIAVYAAMGSEVDVEAFVEATAAHGWNACFPCMVRADDWQTNGNDAAEAGAQPRSRMTFWMLPPGSARCDVEFLAHPTKTYALHDVALAACTRIDACTLDAVVVPLVAFDGEGNRLGYGGGNYDQLLAEVRDHTLVAGVAFEEQRVPSLPLEPHDQPLPHVFAG